MIRFSSFDSLVEDTIGKIRAFGVSSEFPEFCIRKVAKAAAPLLSAEGVVFDYEIALSAIYSANFYIGKAKYSFIRAAKLMRDNFDGTLEGWKQYKSHAFLLPESDASKKLLADYASWMESVGFAKETICFRRSTARWLLVFLDSEGIEATSMSKADISRYLVSGHFEGRKAGGVQAEFSRIGLFLRYMHERGILASPLEGSIPKMRSDASRMIKTMASDDIAAIMSDFPSGKANLRNKAAYCLAVYAGLRSVDIMGLRMGDIDWRSKRISIVQRKTGVRLVTSMNPETANAIMDYIMNERRGSADDHVFISAVGPKKPISGRFSLDYGPRLALAGKPRRGRGLHVLRRTFASSLLASGSTLDVISGALGHLDRGNVNRYLSTDEEAMGRCSLEIYCLPPLSLDGRKV